MPKYRPPQPSAVAWIGVAAILVGLGYAIVIAMASSPKGAITLLAILAGLFAFSAFRVRREVARLRETANGRVGESICEFAQSFERRAVDTWVIRAVYEQLQRQLTHVHARFPVRAEDDLKKDLLLDDDDLDMELALEVAQRTGRTLRSAESNPFFGKVKTAGDLVMFFQAQPKESNAI